MYVVWPTVLGQSASVWWPGIFWGLRIKDVKPWTSDLHIFFIFLREIQITRTKKWLSACRKQKTRLPVISFIKSSDKKWLHKKWFYVEKNTWQKVWLLWLRWWTLGKICLRRKQCILHIVWISLIKMENYSDAKLGTNVTNQPFSLQQNQTKPLLTNHVSICAHM
jgi:hypothetical protein